MDAAPHESAVIALGLVDALMALLVKRAIISPDDDKKIRVELATSLAASPAKLRQDCAAILKASIKPQTTESP